FCKLYHRVLALTAFFSISFFNERMRLLNPIRASSSDLILAPHVACWSSSPSGDKLTIRPSTRGSAGGGPGFGTELTFPQSAAMVKPVCADPTKATRKSGTPVTASMSHQGHLLRVSTNWCAGLTGHFLKCPSSSWSAVTHSRACGLLFGWEPCLEN